MFSEYTKFERDIAKFKFDKNIRQPTFIIDVNKYNFCVLSRIKEKLPAGTAGIGQKQSKLY